jgi:hypothetical protein
MSTLHISPSLRLSAQAVHNANPNTSFLCWDLLILSCLAVLCLVLGGLVYWLQMQEKWHQVAREKRAADEAAAVAAIDAPLIELEAGRRYNIPVEHLRGMEVRVY